VKKESWALTLLISFVIVFGAGLIGSSFVNGGYSTAWYLNNKSEVTPPNYAFGIVWNILFVMIALSLFLALQGARKGREKWVVACVYGINLILNALWSLFFFGMMNAFLGLVDLVLIWLTIIGMIYVSWNIDRRAAWFLIPYLLWVTFAGVLNVLFLMN